MTESDFPDVRELHLFKNMDEQNFKALMRGAYVQTFPAQIDLTTEGEHSDFLHVLLNGSVGLYSTWNGRETNMATVRPVTTFILAATVKDAPCLMSSKTLEKSRVTLIPSEDVRDVFNIDNMFARAIVEELAQLYRSLVKNTKDLKLRTSLERLANYILRQQKRCDDVASFELGMEKRRLASYLGMTPENLSRAFKSLRPYGVAVDNNAITISDQSDLEQFAKPDPLIDDCTT